MTFCTHCGQPSLEEICDACLLRALRMPMQVQLSMEEEQKNRARLTVLTTVQRSPVYEEQA